MFIHDLIKIKYATQGYLPNYPYRMITDKEMCDGFLKEDGFFQSNYPCLAEDLEEDYDRLVEAITYHINQFLTNKTPIPDWVYSFMMGNVISINSDPEDISYLYDLLNIEQDEDDSFNVMIQRQCLKVSEEWIRKLATKLDNRPPTIFGELHVVKSLRLKQLDVLNN